MAQSEVRELRPQQIRIKKSKTLHFAVIMATNAKRENPEHQEHLENSELEGMIVKIRKIEQRNLS